MGLPRRGMLLAVRNVLRTVEDGLLLGGPPCGSWIFINSATHQRKKGSGRKIFGDTAKEYVRNANVILGALFRLACMHGEFFLDFCCNYV